MTTPANAWPTLSPDDGNSGPQNIRWETVKTEEEEYLDKLQSKLSRVMAEGYKRSRSRDKKTSNSYGTTLLDPEDVTDEPAILAVSPDNDEGLHLLYDYALTVSGPSTDDSMQNGNNASMRPAPTPIQPISLTSQPAHFAGTPPDNRQAVQGDLADSPIGRSRTVRFRSRVRIASGVHAISTSSSPCGSASSSISVPLRGSGKYDSSKIMPAPTSTAPLSEMLPTAATNEWLNEISPAGRKRQRSSRQSSSELPADERTPLKVSRRRSYTEPVVETEDADDLLDRLQRANRKTEEQVMFGKWPWRVLNWHWWWWKLGPIFCCCDMFDNESDMG